MLGVILLISVSCSSPRNNENADNAKVQLAEITVKVEGMTCLNCEMSVSKGVNELDGIRSVELSHIDSSAVIQFDAVRTNYEQIAEAIERRGYRIIKLEQEEKRE